MDTEKPCNILEDLVPELLEERAFIRKVYNNDIGRIFFHATLSRGSDLRQCIDQVDRYLRDEEGRSEAWRVQLISYFEAVLTDLLLPYALILWDNANQNPEIETVS